MSEPTHRPTKERSQHGTIELVESAIADEHGRPAQPYRSIDILMALYRRGAISSEMWCAGDDFRKEFRRAHIGDLRAADYSRPHIPNSGGSPHPEINQAHKRVWAAIKCLGGMESAAGSLIWHVIGLEWSLKTWAQMYSTARLRRISQEMATGILIGALAPLTKHYGLIR